MEKPHKQVHHEPTTAHEPATHQPGAHEPHKTKREQLEHNYTYHAPTPEQVERYQKIRDAVKALSFLILELTPESQEQDLAFIGLDACVTFANMSIARH